MTDTSSPSELSRRSLLAGLAAAPIVTAATEQSLAQTVEPRWSPQQAQAALKDAKGTKLVLPVPPLVRAGPLARNDFARDAEQWLSLRA